MKLTYTILLTLSLVCAVYLIKYAYKRRRMPGSNHFIVLLITAIIYNGAYMGEINATSFQVAKFWFDVEHIAIPIQQYLWLMLSLEYIQLPKKRFRTIQYVMLYHPLIYYIVYFSKGLHKFYISSYQFVDNGKFFVIMTEKGPMYFMVVVSGTLFGIISTLAYLDGYRKSSNLQRHGYIIMLVATLFPWMTVYLNAVGIGGGIDYFPMATIVTAGLYMLGIFQFKIFQTIPIATEIVFRQAQEAILLLDIENRIIDVNNAAVKIYPELIKLKKKSMLSVFVTRHPELGELLDEKNKFMFELVSEGETKYYGTEITKILTETELEIGKIIKITDITQNYVAQKQLESIATSAMDKAETNEMSFLQAQISPHFINNSLSVIASMITRAPDEAKVLITDLGEYLANCYYFNSESVMVKLEREIETVKTYMNIEKARFRERLSFQIIGDEIPDIQIPRLVLQPLVENAARHGILKKIEGGNVWLFIKCEEEAIYFEVKDDGVGISKEILSGLLNNEPHKKSIGFMNIHKRLKKYYGEGLSVTSTPGKGTSVSFHIPLNKTINPDQEGTI